MATLSKRTFSSAVSWICDSWSSSSCADSSATTPVLATRSVRMSVQCCPLGRVPLMVQVSAAVPAPSLSVAAMMSYSRWLAATIGTHDDVVTDVRPSRVWSVSVARTRADTGMLRGALPTVARTPDWRSWSRRPNM